MWKRKAAHAGIFQGCFFKHVRPQQMNGVGVWQRLREVLGQIWTDKDKYWLNPSTLHSSPSSTLFVNRRSRERRDTG